MFKLTMDIEIVKPFCTCSLPFSITDHDQFVKVVKMLKPRYVPPSPIIVASHILESVTEQLSEQVEGDLQGDDNVQLIQDG